MAEIRLARVELKEILKAMDDILGSDNELAVVRVSYESGSIGSFVNATFDIKHNGYEGEFTIPITNVDNW